MICPCCGHSREISSPECAACGAKQVGPPLAPPDVLMPKLGPSFAALACGAVIIIAFLITWVFIGDAKVGRALMVSVLGDSLELTKEMVRVDSKLPYYRIFTFDAYRLAFYFSAGAIPISLLGIWLGRRAVRLIKSDSAGFGGIRIARVSYALAACLLIVFSAVAIASIPRAIERGRARRAAATRALMYELHVQALQKYHKEYGAYPHELADLSRVNASGAPQSDYWEHNFDYRPIGVIASKGSAISLSNYTLVSAGPDGEFGTKDDITMVDGVIVDSQNENNSIEGLPARSFPRR
ncbi:MAG: hypothetical protein JMDDDDMK_01310 [Acidobacteria bacterium]|nr:hypothetical protein [Acidobacteriota bacterium]